MSAKFGSGQDWDRALWLQCACTALVGLGAAYASYRHGREFAARFGADPTTAAIWPLIVDGLLTTATVELWRSGRGGGGWTAWLAFLFGVVLSLCGNIAAAPELGVFAVAVAACPPLAMLLAVELLIRAVRRHGTETALETTDETTEGDETDDGTDRVVHLAVVPNGVRLSARPTAEQRMWPGVNGIGSGRNLRGKSTLLNVLMWSLTGRCPQFQNDVRSWIEHVEVDWEVGAEQLRVEFNAVDGVATGQVVSVTEVDSVTRSTVLGQFDGADFEGVMGSLMMSRLRLENIPVWTDTAARVHAWPAYSSSFVVRANQLDPIVGNEQTIGVRMMQMFIGTDWAPVQAAAMTARRGMDTARAAAKDQAQAAGEAVEASRRAAEKDVQDFQAKIGRLPVGTPDVQVMLEAATHASDISRRVHRLEVKLIAQSSLAETARQQLKAVKARVHTRYEDALAARFFHRMRPSVCPRCAAQVTPERQAAEPDNHECSVCASDLNLEALQSDVIVAASVPQQLAASLVAGMSGDDGEDGDAEDGPLDEIEAAQTSVTVAEAAVARLTVEIAELTTRRDAAAARAEVGGELLTAASDRRALELDLARAEGALTALTRSSDPTTVDPVDPVQLAVVEAAEQVLKKWVKNDQDPMLVRISADIERLTRSFGADNLSGFALSGAATMALRENGVKQIYSGLTAGEKLRVKIATAIALIQHGYVEGIGRHPGFLVLDSPSAEEMPEEDLATMVKALQDVASEAEMQIFVATRNAAPLVELLPKANRVVAEGNSYVW